MRKLGIIGAMDVEVEILQGALAQPEVTRWAGMTFWQGTLQGLPVVVVRSGIGKVNAALCVQVLADRMGVTHVVNTGVAGALDPALNIGDIVISTEARYHDITTGPLGDPRGQVPGMDVLAFPADPTMVAMARAACGRLGLPHRLGRVVSGDQFVCEDGVKADILQACGGICVEMEGAAIAHAAYRNRLPVVVLRAISDKADHSASMDYVSFEAKAAANCAALTQALAQALAR